MLPTSQLTKDTDIFDDPKKCVENWLAKLNYITVMYPNIAYSVGMVPIYIFPQNSSLGSIGTDFMLLKRATGCAYCTEISGTTLNVFL